MKCFRQRHVEAVLGLAELGSGGDLLGEADRAEIVGRREGVLGGAQEHLRRGRDLAAGQETPLVAHGPDRLKQRDRVEIEDRLGLGMIAALHAVARQAQDVADAQRGGAEHVRPGWRCGYSRGRRSA